MKGKIKVGFYQRISADVFDSTDYIEVIKRRHIDQQRRETIRHLHKGLRVMEWKTKIGRNGDDFLRDMVTMVTTGFAFKIPRFVRNYLLRKVYKVKKIKH